jgi:hypothetical protein
MHCQSNIIMKKKALMSLDMFKEWFFQEFAPQTEQFLNFKNLPPKAILLHDNVTRNILTKGELKNITVMFLPPNVASLCQLMDQGTLETMDRRL